MAENTPRYVPDPRRPCGDSGQRSNHQQSAAYGVGGSAIARGYLLMATLACATLAAVGLRLHREQRLTPTLAALERGQVIAFADELASGRIGDVWRRGSSTWLAGQLPGTLRAQLDTLTRASTAHHDDTSATGSREARPPPSDPQLSDADRRLDTFFQALYDLEQGKRDKARVLFFGTSEIGHDRVTSQMRRHLQERFGDGGKGWVLIDRTWAILDHRDVIWTHEEANWQSFSIRTAALKHGHYGLGGVLVESLGPAWAEYRTVEPGHANSEGYHEFPSGTAWSQIEVHYQSHPLGKPLSIAIDERAPVVVQTRSAELSDEVFQARVADGPHRLRIETRDANVHAYGVVLERDRGLVVDALMVIGAWGHSITHYDAAHLGAQVGMRDPALVIFQLGAKESLRYPELSPQQLRDFVTGFRRSIEMVMTGRESTACLVVSPKDQAYQVSGRMETRPAIPRLVRGAAEVARDAGCAFYNLYESMGGEGTARRWYHQEPRLVSSDLGHLTPEGSIRIGEILSDVLLDEYDAFRTWRTGTEPALLRVADTSGPTTAAQREILASIREDSGFELEPCIEAGKSVIDCRDPLDWIRHNERGHPLWAPHIQDLGGGYVGVGSDQSYDIIAEAKSEWAWIFSDDLAVIYLHEILLAVMALAETPEAFLSALSRKNAAATRAAITDALASSRFTPAERVAIAGTFDDVRPALERYMRRSRRARPMFPEWGWLHVPESYAFIRSLVEAGRIRTVRASLLGDQGLRGIGDCARELGVAVRVLYLSNEESLRKRIPRAMRDNLRSLPLDEQTLVLRTLRDQHWNRDRDFSKWHYAIHEGLHLQDLLGQRRYRSPEQAMKDAALMDDCLSWIGPLRGGQNGSPETSRAGEGL